MLAAPCLLCRYLYSVHLKPLTGVKNFVCATTVASAIGLGAIAMGGGSRSVLAAVSYTHLTLPTICSV